LEKLTLPDQGTAMLSKLMEYVPPTGASLKTLVKTMMTEIDSITDLVLFYQWICLPMLFFG